MGNIVFLFVTFTVTRLLIGDFFFDTPVCVDGWASGSIGNQGACSHHGGVQGQPATAFFISMAVAIGALIAVRHREIRDTFTSEPTRATVHASPVKAQKPEAAAYTDAEATHYTDAEMEEIIAKNKAREEATREYLRSEAFKRDRRNKRK
jgi:hypothetical protein